MKDFKQMLKNIGKRTGTEYLFDNVDTVLSSVVTNKPKEKTGLRPNDNPTYDEINKRFGNSFLKIYFQENLSKTIVRVAGHSEEGIQNIVNAILNQKELYLDDEDGFYPLRPIKYSIQYGKKDLWSETNKYGLIPDTIILGNIIDRQFWTKDPFYDNPGRLREGFNANPIGITEDSLHFYYITVTFQRAYEY